MSSWFIESGLLQTIQQAGDELAVAIHAVGGCVRDRLLARESRDMDFAVDNGALRLARTVADRSGGSYFPLDLERDTARVVYKVQGETYYLDFAGLRGPDLDADLRMRDFTINAIAAPIDDWTSDSPRWIDPTGGRQDLEERLLRAASSNSFRADPLRTLRAVRLAGSLRLRLDSDTESLIRRDAPLLVNVAEERIRDELALIMAAENAYAQLLDLDRLGLLELIFPEMVPLRGVEQGPWHFWDVYEHSLRSVQALEALHSPEVMLVLVEQEGIWASWEELQRPFARRTQSYLRQTLSGERSRQVLLGLATLLHDIAKPGLRRVDTDGTIRFFGHDKAGAPLVGAILRRLRFSASEVNEGQAIVEHHMRPGFLNKAGEVTRRAAYRFFQATGEAAIAVLLVSLADYLATKGRSIEVHRWERHLATVEGLMRLYYDHREVVDPPRLVTGDDLMRCLHIPSGPQIGRLLEAIREAQAVGEVQSREEALALARQQMESEDSGCSQPL